MLALADAYQHAVGVASIDKDLINVRRVLRLSWPTKVFKIVLPSSLPLIFTGLRLSLGVGWMVLIAAEMLAQNPGLGKFVWDEFQNGSSASLARIMVAVFTIGIIGFLLDRIMLALQSRVHIRREPLSDRHADPRTQIACAKSLRANGRAGTRVLKNVSLAVEEGEFVAIVGFSGIGQNDTDQPDGRTDRARYRR